MHGYGIYQELSQMQGISMIWNVKQSMLYVMLDKLEAEGLLSSSLIQNQPYPPRKIFHITGPGKQFLKQWMKTPVRRARQMRQEFLAKLIIARRYGPSAALELIRAQQQACQRWLKQLNTDFPPNDPEHFNTWLVDDYRIHRLKAILNWLDLCERKFIDENTPA